ncbi:MAG TPA: 16S rRNA (guanine(527)-N(7))-methyltransferase RsmG [Phycisphaerales bacterium]|nr:16S rRNA (guanine(527)-N(7))-methyltransferase RsmG [Phycisphaerales bacterium]
MASEEQREAQSADSAAREARVFRIETVPEAITPPQSFVRACADYGVELDPGDGERLGLFLALLLEANKAFNLTAITEPGAAWEKHIFDALTLVPLLAELPEGSLVGDVGSGGGVPALPLAIVMPGLSFTLIEATGKKGMYLEEVARVMGLKNVRVVNGRSEDVGQRRAEGKKAEDGRRREEGGEKLGAERRPHPGPLSEGDGAGNGSHEGRKSEGGSQEFAGRELFDVVTARALGPLNVAAELTLPLTKVGGRALLVKGQKADEELVAAKRALALLGGEHEGTLDTPTGRIVVLRKVKPTPRTYPRKAGEPKRAPL